MAPAPSSGAVLYAEAFSTMKATVLTWGNFGKLTLPQVLGINHWLVIIPLVAATLILFRWFEKKRL